MLEVKECRWFGRLDDGSPKVKWMRRVYPLVDYTQAPWTVVIPRQPSQSIHTSRQAYTFRRRFRIPYVFSRASLRAGNTAEVVPSFATSNTEFDPTLLLHTLGVPRKLYVAHTYTHLYCN